MAERPVFIPRFNGVQFVEETPIEFTWHSGFSAVQKKKNVVELHRAAKNKGYGRILEISTKSEELLGVRLSAFNLKIDVPGVGRIPLECAFQGSKVYAQGGPYTDLYHRSPLEAKRDERLKNSGVLVCFLFGDSKWGLEPKTAFYDWLYIKALYEHREFLRVLFSYDGFTDIEFNPAKSLNCQARSCALLVSLMKNDLLSTAVESKESFINVLERGFITRPHTEILQQGALF